VSEIQAPRFDPDIPRRISEGDATVLHETVTLEDGITIPWSAVTKWDIEVMGLWMHFQEDVAKLRLAEIEEELKRRGEPLPPRREHLTAVNNPRELRRPTGVDERFSDMEN
jgi:hypothetical protein